MAESTPVESANVVGYQDMEFASLQFITPNFVKMDGTDFILDDFLPADKESWDVTSCLISCFTGLSKDYDATWVSQALIDELAIDFPKLAGKKAGWYNYDDVCNLGSEDEYDDIAYVGNRAVPFGASGFAINSEIAIRFVGEVKQSDTSIESSSIKFIGNCSPVDHALDDFRPADAESWDVTSCLISCFTGLSKDYDATWVSQALIDELAIDFPKLAGKKAGWYNYDDVCNLGSEDEYDDIAYVGNRSVPAGTGFAVNSEAAISIPNPIPAK